MLCCLHTHTRRWQDLTTTLCGPEVAIFKEACKKNKVWAATAAQTQDMPRAHEARGWRSLCEVTSQVVSASS
jgi:hypothetical protein